MNNEAISITLALWLEGFYSDEEVKAWADNQIMGGFGDPENCTIELALEGPEFCCNKHASEFPRPAVFDFKDRFSVRLSNLSFTSKTAIEEFIRWAAQHASEEDITCSEVQFSQQLKILLEADYSSALLYFENQVKSLMDESLLHVTALKMRTNC